MFDMLGINDRVAPAALDQFIQTLLAFDERQTPQILTVEPQQIESIEDGLALAGHQFVKLANAITVETDNFAVDNGVLYRHFPERFLQGRERFEVVQVARDKLARGGCGPAPVESEVISLLACSLCTCSPDVGSSAGTY